MGAFGSFQRCECLVLADTAEKAIEIAKENCLDSKTDDWTAIEINTEVFKNSPFYYISERSS